MIWRALPALLATTLLATSGLAGAALHLCGMEGLVRSHCCCHQSDHTAPPVQLKRIDDCCDTVMSGGEHPLINADATKLTIDPPLLVAGTVPTCPDFTTSDEDAVLTFARGPPPSHGPPLFVKHCSYLN